MLYWAIVFWVLALLAGFLGFREPYAAGSGPAQVLFFVFLVVFLIALVNGLVGRAVKAERRQRSLNDEML